MRKRWLRQVMLELKLYIAVEGGGQLHSAFSSEWGGEEGLVRQRVQ